MKHVSFRMSAEVHADYVSVAESRGVDLSAMLNWILTEFRPEALLLRAKNEAAMLAAGVVALGPNLRSSPASKQALRELEELISSLRDTADKLAKQVSASGAKAA
jgi:hypothetical protein